MKIVRYIILVLFSNALYCQEGHVADTIRKTAIACEAPGTVSQDVYAALRNYKVICLGEMHGTQEPAELLLGLAKSFVSNKRKVLVGMEIAPAEMEDYLRHPDTNTLMRTLFFSGQTNDARASEAWFKTIAACAALGIKICFFDGRDDKQMYENLLACYNADTTAVALTLSGNIHNKLLPHGETKTMGCYLKEHFGRKVFSINHIYNEGTVYNNTSEGLKLRSVPPINNAFATSTNYACYFIPNIFDPGKGYSAYFYTRTVNASLPKKR